MKPDGIALRSLAIVLLLLIVLIPARAQMLTPAGLTCEFLNDPLGIDNSRPRLGWHLESRQKGEFQTAYQVIVSTSPARLKTGTGDLWDSGRIPGPQSHLVRYQGTTLRSHQVCYWKVRAWDRAGKAGPWSRPARWTMGILDPAEWTGEWIGFDAPRQQYDETNFADTRWIWSPGSERFSPGPPRCVAATTFDIPSDRRVTGARLAVAASGGYALHLNGTRVASSASAPESWKTPQRLDVSSFLNAGRNVIYAEAENDSTAPAGFILWLHVTFAGGESRVVRTDNSWKTSETPNPVWLERGPAEGEGVSPRIVCNFGSPPWRLLDGEGLVLPPPRVLGTSFNAPRPVRRATLYATALGICEISLNGKRVSGDRFTPGWTDYSRRVYYRTYDVTGLVKKGKNAVEAVLADGWFAGYVGYAIERDHYGKKTRLKAELRLEYEDGTVASIATGKDWYAATGPTREADFLMGETYDARMEANQGRMEKFPVDLGADVSPRVQAHPAPPVRPFAELPAVSITQPAAGVYVFDLGQNFAGVARLRVEGKKGRKITLRFGERLNPDGTLYTDNLRGARAVDTYICRGKGVETWEPRFTFHGFQYVEVSGLSAPPGRRTITGVALSSDTPPAGEFVCSDSLVNRLYRNILWTQRANFIDVPTDCPQRDERLGWTGDAQVYCRSACLNTDAQAFFHKWIVDLMDAQRNDGQFPMVAPLKVAGGDGGPAWADAGVICPWTIYEVYGDTTILELHYDAMKRFVEFSRSRCTGDLLPPPEFHCFGDWLNISAETPHDVIFTAYFARCADLVGRAAAVLGKTGEANRYRTLFDSVRASFQRAYMSEEGKVKGETQTGYVLALAFGLLDDSVAAQAKTHLIGDIEKRGWRLSTGFVGTKDLMLTLSSLGRNDIACRLLLNETFPSWGFTIRHGATSIWERWDGWTPEKGFQNPEMNSFAHYAFGAVYQWMVENIGGIRSDGAGFRRLVLAPEPGRGLTWAETEYNSVNGKIRTEWRVSRGRLKLTVWIPANTSAIVVLPRVGGPITESGKPIRQQRHIRPADGGEKRFEVGSGRYRFEYALR